MLKTKGWFIRQNVLLGDLPERELDLLEQVAESQDLRRRGMIWEMGGAANYLYIVRGGIIKVYKTSDEGRELTLHFFTKDQLFGEREKIKAFSYEQVTKRFAEASAAVVDGEGLTG